MNIFAFLLSLFLLSVTSILIGNVLIYSKFFSRKYVTLSFANINNDSRTFNIIINILYPNVFVVLLYKILLSIRPNGNLNYIWLMVPAYYIVRLFLIVLQDRHKTINIKHELIMDMTSTIIANSLYYLYHIKAVNIFFDFSDMINGIWLMLLVFLYDLIKSVLDGWTTSDYEARENRISDYIHSKHNIFQSRYDNILHEILKNEYDKLAPVVYAIMIYENYTRTRLHRLAENFIRPFHNFSDKPTSMGIMQVQTYEKISDEKSVQLGTDHILSKWNEIKDDDTFDHYDCLRELICSYNLSDDYFNEVESIYNIINNDSALKEDIEQYEDETIAEYLPEDLSKYFTDYMNNYLDKSELAKLISYLYLGSEFRLIKIEDNYALMQHEQTYETVPLFWCDDLKTSLFETIQEKLKYVSRRFIVFEKTEITTEPCYPNTLVLSPSAVADKYKENYFVLPEDIQFLIPLSLEWTIPDY